jgi:outer membrane receptor protein involved in Fe transport
VDGNFGVQLTPEFSVGLSYDKYFYQTLYKNLSPVANIEQRGSLILDYDKDRFDISTTVNWIGARNLRPYGYKDRFNVTDGTNQTSRKNGHSPDFFTVDFQSVFKLTKDSSFTFGVRNLFDYTQTESPLYFNGSGEFDVNHIWGPLMGRQVYAGIKSIF